MQNLFSPLFGRFGSAGLSAPQSNSTGSAMTTPSWQSGNNFWVTRLPNSGVYTPPPGVPNNFDASAPGGSPAVGMPTLDAVNQLPPAGGPAHNVQSTSEMPGAYEIKPTPMIPPDPNATSMPPAMPSILDPLGTGGQNLMFGAGMGGAPIDQHAMANAMAQQQYMTPPNAGDGVFADPNAQPPWANAGGQSYADDVGFDLGTGLWDDTHDTPAPPPADAPTIPAPGFNYQTGNYQKWKSMNPMKRMQKYNGWQPLSPKQLAKVNSTGQLPGGASWRKGKLGINQQQLLAQNNLAGPPGKIGSMYSGMYGNTGPAHQYGTGWQYMNDRNGRG